MPLAIVKETEVRGKGKRPRVYGHMVELDTGEVVYLARRKHREIFRSGRLSISGAMSDGEACWAIDLMLLISLRTKKITRIGVRVIDTGDLYLTELANFFTRGVFRTHNYEGVGRGGSEQRALPLTFWVTEKGVVSFTP